MYCCTAVGVVGVEQLWWEGERLYPQIGVSVVGFRLLPGVAGGAYF